MSVGDKVDCLPQKAQKLSASDRTAASMDKEEVIKYFESLKREQSTKLALEHDQYSKIERLLKEIKQGKFDPEDWKACEPESDSAGSTDELSTDSRDKPRNASVKKQKNENSQLSDDDVDQKEARKTSHARKSAKEKERPSSTKSTGKQPTSTRPEGKTSDKSDEELDPKQPKNKSQPPKSAKGKEVASNKPTSQRKPSNLTGPNRQAETSDRPKKSTE